MTEKKAPAAWPTAWNQDVAGNLAYPFHPGSVKWRPGSKSRDGARAMAMAYIDARDVMDRLDTVVGPNGWHDEYSPLADGGYICRLTVLGITKTDIGYPNAPGDVEAGKGAVSDALKRTAVKFGIGRELYDMPQFWLPLDSGGRFAVVPTYVAGKGWIVPGNEPPKEQRSPASGGSKATDAMRRKVFAALKEANLAGDDAKGFCKTLTGKDSSADWTVADIDVLLTNLADLKKAA